MAEFKLHLASELVTEQKTVTYRSLARSQKVHANLAKCMLYDFYEEQKKRKPGSVYATYLLSGVKKQEKPAASERDVSMRSSPPPSSSMPQSQAQSQSQSQPRVEDVKVKTITLVREEDLGDVQNTYESISSIQIYSLSPGKIPDLMTLSDITRSLYSDVFAKEDPLIHNKTYGVVQNPQVRRRKGKRPIIPTASAPKVAPGKDVKPATPALKKEGSSKEISPSNKPASTLKKADGALKSQPLKKDETASSRESTPKPATLKRDASDIFKAFAKSKTKPKDTPMMDTDDGEEDETLFEPKHTSKSTKRPSDVKQERDDKAAKLRKMMDSDDEEDEQPAAKATEKQPAEAEAKATDDEDEDMAWSDSDTEKKPKPASSQAAAPDAAAEEPPTGPKRKRGRRKVLKKRTMKDADGYLVTKEEEAWESFSESDNEKAKPKAFGGFAKKAAPPPTKKAAAAAAGGKKNNIMSFFGKK